MVDVDVWFQMHDVEYYLEYYQYGYSSKGPDVASRGISGASAASEQAMHVRYHDEWLGRR
jgi:hypothetical protein